MWGEGGSLLGVDRKVFKYSWRSYRIEQTGNGASLISGNAVVKDSKLGRGILSKTDKQNTLIPLNKQNGICFKLTIRLSLNFSNKNGGGWKYVDAIHILTIYVSWYGVLMSSECYKTST